MTMHHPRDWWRENSTSDKGREELRRRLRRQAHALARRFEADGMAPADAERRAWQTLQSDPLTAGDIWLAFPPSDGKRRRRGKTSKAPRCPYGRRQGPGGAGGRQ